MERLGLGVAGRAVDRGPRPGGEFVTLLGAVTGTLAKIGNEVYNLQRPEIGEVSEAPREGVVGSITMPQKRNPERSEHLSTLARIVRAAAGLALEGLVAEHERDGAAWKTEWALLPQACTAAATALALGAELVSGLGSTPSACARTSRPSAATSSPSRSCSRSRRARPAPRARAGPRGGAARAGATASSFRDALAPSRRPPA